jgi:hypothetical protein
LPPQARKRQAGNALFLFLLRPPVPQPGDPHANKQRAGVVLLKFVCSRGTGSVATGPDDRLLRKQQRPSTAFRSSIASGILQFRSAATAATGMASLLVLFGK